MFFFILTYEAHRQCYTLWLVNHNYDVQPGEAKFDSVLRIGDGEFGRVESLVEELKNEFDHTSPIGPFIQVIPSTPKSVKLVVKIAETLARHEGHNRGRLGLEETSG